MYIYWHGISRLLYMAYVLNVFVGLINETSKSEIYKRKIRYENLFLED